MYIFGQGIDNADYAEAMRYFRMSAEAGSVEGQSNVGLMYYSGRGMKSIEHLRSILFFSPNILVVW